MMEDMGWRLKLKQRKMLRERYFAEHNPDTVKKNLLQDFKSFVLEAKEEDLQELIDWAYHPQGKETPSWGMNPYFQALLSISDQLFIYQEFLQEILFHFSQEISMIVPAKVQTAHLKLKKEKAPLHYELQQEISLKDKILEESPNKSAIFNLIDGKRSLTEIWRLFNENHRDKADKNTWVSKQYITQVIKDLENAQLIVVQRQGKIKIPRRIS
ncbi:MAG: hypothetical protein ACFFC7_07160 [Candidatus Hermodarchaeota archaeon]